MWPRKLFDISWRDLAFGGMKCIGPRAPRGMEPYLEEMGCDLDHSMISLSVRSGFDLLLGALRLPIGSEVIMTAITIPDMIDIVRRHGLVPVPLDLDFATLSPSITAFQDCITESTCLIVVAHLFGSRMPMAPILKVARQRGLLVVEDCAQAFEGRDRVGAFEGDALLYSFGPIKTATSLGGGLVFVRSSSLLKEMRKLQDQYPVQTPWSYALRIAKYATLKLVSQRLMYGAILWICRQMKKDPDLLINGLARNFGKRDLFESIRCQPCNALMAMIARRWLTYSPSRAARREMLGKSLKELLSKVVAVPGSKAEKHSYWVFPIVTSQSESLIKMLQRDGVDGTRSHNLTVVEGSNEYSDRDASVMRKMLENVVFLPVYPEMTSEAIARIAAIASSSVPVPMAESLLCDKLQF